LVLLGHTHIFCFGSIVCVPTQKKSLVLVFEVMQNPINFFWHHVTMLRVTVTHICRVVTKSLVTTTGVCHCDKTQRDTALYDGGHR